jgi:cytochrome c peroxidase
VRLQHIATPPGTRRGAGLLLLLALTAFSCDAASTRPPAPPAAAEAAPPASLAPGDDRSGYDDPAYTSRSRALSARRGSATDLLARLSTPPLGLPPVPAQDRSDISSATVALGRSLFFDRRLSANGTLSCAMCHVPEQGFAQRELKTPVGLEGRSVRRNAPTVLNAVYQPLLFHDGREISLQTQIWAPLLAANEMANVSAGDVIRRLRTLDDYAERFADAFGRPVTMETLGLALAAYQSTLIAGDSPFDRWAFGGDADALSAAARRGYALFVGRAGCSACHLIGTETALFTDHRFHDTGIGYDRAMRAEPLQQVQLAPGVFVDVDPEVGAQLRPRPAPDLGRYEVTRDPADRWKYRTPSLRNVAETPPYMHDGSFATLADVLAFYNAGGLPAPGRDPLIRPLGLSPAALADLEAFLRALTSSDLPALVADALAAPIGDY